jgi:hypothetical protein
MLKIEAAEKLEASDKQRSRPKDFRGKSRGFFECFPENAAKPTFHSFQFL